ncbi:MAG: DUF2095 family protein [Candidatus Bathyarchaeota archaeon]|jgi:hypothetical protein
MDKDKFRKLFPHLAEEIEKGVSKVDITVDEGEPGVESTNDRKWSGYDPDVNDFLRRCKTEKQAEEIIDYLEEKGEINTERAAVLREKLKEEGLRSFGEKKKPGFYHRNIR